MFRYLVAHVPTFRLDRCGWSDPDPVVLVAEERNALRVQTASLTAARRGIRRGMSVAAARARIPALETELLDPTGEADDLQALTAQLLRISPTIAPLPPDALVAEVSRLPDRERVIIERVRIRLEHLGHRAAVVVADDPNTALMLARWRARDQIIPPGDGAAAIATLPLNALELPTAEAQLLDCLGISTIGAFAALPPSAVVGRLGPTGVAAHALARGRGPTPTLSPWNERDPLTLKQELPTPVAELEALLFVLAALIRDATGRRSTARQGATRLEIDFKLDGGAHQTLSIRLGAPTRQANGILAQVRHRLDPVKLGGHVCTVTLRFPEPIPFDGQQLDLRDPLRNHEAIENVTARLQDALGGSSVLAARAVARHRPEGAWRPVPFGTPSIPSNSNTASAALRQHHADDPVEAWQGHPALAEPRRPPILLSPPQAIEVEGEFPIQAIHVDGRWQAVVSVTGPEQLSGEWWARPFQRTYWRARLEDGRTAWVYRELGQWAVHGWWDR